MAVQVDEPSFAALRTLTLLRVQLHGLQEQLRNVNFANASEQVRGAWSAKAALGSELCECKRQVQDAWLAKA